MESEVTAKWKWLAGAGALVVALGIVGFMAPKQAGGTHDGPVSVTVPGAMSLSIHCGGDDTTHANGEQATFTPDGNRCDIEAPLTAVMPLRGTLELDGHRAYECARDSSGMELVCGPRG